MKIAFVGKAGSGKTTLANYLVQKYDFTRLSFAKKVKQFGVAILLRGMKKNNPAFRKFLQMLGEGARVVDPNIWIRWLDMELTEYDEAGVSVVIDDCRYKNEADFLRADGFVLVKVKGRLARLPDELTKHVSEVELDEIECDCDFDNSQDLHIAAKQLDLLIGRLTNSHTDKNLYMALRLAAER